ncbi:hypothetical protein P5673_019074 [Acropora cervicornis]|uniref:Uncharacterized protein n=1 Tax=Acropora cervicornis TaxID=6130 RepID=A0AAD9V2I3_ACRCE|nr:hypothetical protein P5673_019074 [Acropora cervicornis]
MTECLSPDLLPRFHLMAVAHFMDLKNYLIHCPMIANQHKEKKRRKDKRTTSERKRAKKEKSAAASTKTD